MASTAASLYVSSRIVCSPSAALRLKKEKLYRRGRQEFAEGAKATESLCGLCASFAAFALKRSFSSGRKGVLGRLLGQGKRARFGKGDGGLESADDVALHGFHPGVVEFALVPELPLEQRDRILPLPRFDLPWIARVGLPPAFRVGALAIGLALVQS